MSGAAAIPSLARGAARQVLAVGGGNQSPGVFIHERDPARPACGGFHALLHRPARVISDMLLKQGIAPNEHIGFLIAAARRRINQALGGRLRHYRLTPRQFWILIAIREHPGLSLSDIVAHLRMDYPTASRVVFALRRRRLVEVREDAADRRRSRLYLGPVGDALAEEIHGLATSIRGAVTQGLRGSEREALRALLGRVIANMDRFHDGRLTHAPSKGDENSPSSAKI